MFYLSFKQILNNNNKKKKLKTNLIAVKNTVQYIYDFHSNY